MENETHKLAEAKLKENKKMMEAFGIKEQDYNEGDAFNPEIQEQKKQERIAISEAKKAAYEQKKALREIEEKERVANRVRDETSMSEKPKRDYDNRDRDETRSKREFHDRSNRNDSRDRFRSEGRDSRRRDYDDRESKYHRNERENNDRYKILFFSFIIIL